MSTSAETDVQQPEDSSGVPTAPSQGQGDGQQGDGSLVSAHTDDGGVQPMDGSLVSAHTEPGGVQPMDGSLVSAHTDTGTTQE